MFSSESLIVRHLVHRCRKPPINPLIWKHKYMSETSQMSYIVIRNWHLNEVANCYKYDANDIGKSINSISFFKVPCHQKWHHTRKMCNYLGDILRGEWYVELRGCLRTHISGHPRYAKPTKPCNIVLSHQLPSCFIIVFGTIIKDPSIIVNIFMSKQTIH